MKVPLALAMLFVTALAGCSGSNAAPESWVIQHSESSERSRVTIDSIPRDSFSYEHLFVDVEGKRYSFGEFASFEDRRYQVDGKKDPDAMVERGDILTIIAAGQNTIKILRDAVELAAYEANIPDNRAPPAPLAVEPTNQASGVSARPTFRWNSVADPGGVTYTLMYAPDPSFQLPLLTMKAEDILANTFTVASGKELVEGQRYWWRVQAVDAAGNASPWSAVAEFLVAGGPAG